MATTDNVAAGYDAIKEAHTDPSQPRAYLNYLFFDEDMHFVPDQSGVIQVTQGSNGSWAVLASSGRIVMNRNGYFNVFASTEDYNVPVLIDNMKVSYSRGGLLEEGGLQLYDFHARQYDPQIGRF